jgi:hypothetical protein
VLRHPRLATAAAAITAPALMVGGTACAYSADSIAVDYYASRTVRIFAPLFDQTRNLRVGS